MKIETWQTERVRAYENNPRVNDHAVKAVAGSIEKFGFRQPIVVDADGVIVVGHTRWKAAAALGLEEVPVHVAVGLTPDECRAYRIADNKTNDLSEWDDAKLSQELDALRHANVDLAGLGFDGDELKRLLGDAPVERGLKYATTYEIVIECVDEKEQRSVYDKLTEESYRCRVLTY